MEENKNKKYIPASAVVGGPQNPAYVEADMIIRAECEHVAREETPVVKSTYSDIEYPSEAAARKGAPLARGCLDYFPDALEAVAELSRVGNEQHNPGQPMHWAKEKSTDHADCAMRHLRDRGKMDSDKIRHSTKAAWRALANLQIELDEARAKEKMVQVAKDLQDTFHKERSRRIVNHGVSAGVAFDLYEEFFHKLNKVAPQEVVLDPDTFFTVVCDSCPTAQFAGLDFHEVEEVELAFDHGPVVFRKGK